MSNELLPAQPNSWDRIHLLARTLLSTLPIVGGPALELFNAIVTPPLERRKNEWMENIAIAIAQLEQRDNDVIHRIIEDEEFTSVLVHATYVALRNHQSEKLDALKNAVVNTARGLGAGQDLELLFIRYVDELTPMHLKVLNFLIQAEKEVQRETKYQQIYKLFKKCTGLELSEDFFGLACADLKARSLVRLSDDLEGFPGLYEVQALTAESTNNKPTAIVTEIGRKFREYILTDRSVESV